MSKFGVSKEDVKTGAIAGVIAAVVLGGVEYAAKKWAGFNASRKVKNGKKTGKKSTAKGAKRTKKRAA